jgi:hypothetical protein
VKIRAHAVMQGDPEIDLRAKTRPVEFEVRADGSLRIATGVIAAEIGEIPVKLRIPFLRRRRNLIAVGSIGGFGIRISPAEAELRPFGVHVAGVLGKDGLDCDLKGRVCCKTEFDLDGVIPGKVTRVAFDVGSEGGGEEEES